VASLSQHFHLLWHLIARKHGVCVLPSKKRIISHTVTVWAENRLVRHLYLEVKTTEHRVNTWTSYAFDTHKSVSTWYVEYTISIRVTCRCDTICFGRCIQWWWKWHILLKCLHLPTYQPLYFSKYKLAPEPILQFSGNYVYRRCFNLRIVKGHPPVFLMISTEKVLVLYLGKCIICHHILQCGSLHSHCYENLKSCMFFVVLYSLEGLMSACIEYKSNVDRFKNSKNHTSCSCDFCL